MHSVTSETDYEMIRYIQQKLVFERIVPAKSMSEILHELFQELNQLKSEFTGELFILDFSPPSILLLLLSDEPKTVSSHFSDFDRTRFDGDAIHTPDNCSRHPRPATIYRLRRQQPTEESSARKTRTEKIRMKDALDILEPYYTRYQQRCTGKIRYDEFDRIDWRSSSSQ